MILFHLFVWGMRTCVQGLGWMIWACLAFAGAMLVCLFGGLAALLGDRGRLMRQGFHGLRPPAYLIRKSRT